MTAAHPPTYRKVPCSMGNTPPPFPPIIIIIIINNYSKLASPSQRIHYHSRLAQTPFYQNSHMMSTAVDCRQKTIE